MAIIRLDGVTYPEVHRSRPSAVERIHGKRVLWEMMAGAWQFMVAVVLFSLASVALPFYGIYCCARSLWRKK